MFGIGTIKKLQAQVQNLQSSISILIGDAQMRETSRGNPYMDYKAAIAELANKYEGIAEWGNLQTKNIVDIRSAFIIGQGIKLAVDDQKDKDSREMEFVKDLITRNDLDEEMPQELAKEGEIEGRTLVKLIPNDDAKSADFRFISYSATGYKVKTAVGDYKTYESVVYRDTDKSVDVELKAAEFVYKKFSGRLQKVNDIMPKCAAILRFVEDLDKALWDWRAINHLYAAPTPTFKVEEKGDIKALTDWLKEFNWKIGKSLVTTAEYKLVGADPAGIDNLEKEIMTLVKLISGAVGVPVHFLGLPELMGNRAVSTDLIELIVASTNKERHIWEGFYEEMFDKAIEIANVKYQFNMRKGIVKVRVLQITESKIRELVDIWLPLYSANVIDLDYFLSKIPDIEPDAVKTAQREAAMKQLEQIKAYEAQASAQAGQGGAQ